jgi:lambda family phage portal protein
MFNFFKKKEKESVIDKATESLNQKRAFKAVKATPTNPITPYKHINKDIFDNVDKLRNLARELEKNNGYTKRYISVIVANVVGDKGFKFTAKAKNFDGTYDELVNNIIEKEFFKWCERCETSGLNFLEVQKLAVASLVRDGEILIRDIYKNGQYFIQVLDSERIVTKYNDPNQNILSGIKTDEYGFPIAYYLKDELTDYSTYKAYDAKQINHVFNKINPEQIRGYSYIAPVAIQLSQLEGFQEAAIIAARTGASKMGFYTLDSSNDPSVLADNDASTDDLYDSVAPGQFGILPSGYDFKSFDPQYPDAVYKDFVKTTLRTIAAGLNVSYNSLANDLESVNYSSIRAGVIEEREHYKIIQTLIETKLLNPIFEKWLKNALTTGILKLNDKSFGIDKFDKFNDYRFVGRRWLWVDPKKDAEANILAINAGLTSITDVIEEKGEDLINLLEKIKRERDLLEQYGITLEKVIVQPDNEINQNN